MLGFVFKRILDKKIYGLFIYLMTFKLDRFIDDVIRSSLSLVIFPHKL